MSTGRFKDREWNLANDKGQIGTWEQVGIAVLMDIRDELRSIRAALQCSNTQSIPQVLRAIERNTKKRKLTKK